MFVKPTWKRDMFVLVALLSAGAGCKQRRNSADIKDIGIHDDLNGQNATVYSDYDKAGDLMVYFKECRPKSPKFDRTCDAKGTPPAPKKMVDFKAALNAKNEQTRNRIQCYLTEGADFIVSMPPPATTTVAKKCSAYGQATKDDQILAFNVFGYSLEDNTSTLPSSNYQYPVVRTNAEYSAQLKGVKYAIVGLNEDNTEMQKYFSWYQGKLPIIIGVAQIIEDGEYQKFPEDKPNNSWPRTHIYLLDDKINFVCSTFRGRIDPSFYRCIDKMTGISPPPSM